MGTGSEWKPSVTICWFFYVPSFQYHSTQVMIIYLQHVLAKKNNGIHGVHYMDCKVLYRQLNYLTYLQDRYYPIFNVQFTNEKYKGVLLRELGAQAYTPFQDP